MNSQHVDHIPVLWFEPANSRAERELVIFIPPFSGTKEHIAPFLKELSSKGFVALSFDPWLQGERGTESQDQMMKRAFANFRRQMWPALGQTTLDTLKVIDWSIKNLQVTSKVRIVGLSMGGDVAVAAAGIDQRIARVAAVAATPDWLRPGMKDLFTPTATLPPGDADAYAQYFYDLLNPITHLERYARQMHIRFFCGDKDTHVPPDGAQRFQAALKKDFPDGAKVEVRMIQGMGHTETRIRDMWWPDTLTWLVANSF